MMPYTTIDEALVRAKQIKDKSTDECVTTRNLRFECNGEIRVATGKDEPFRPLRGQAISQLTRILQIPNQWVKVKQVLEDPEHLADSLNRHTKRLPSTGLLVRGYQGNDGEYIRAVFHDNKPMLDIYTVLRILQARVDKKISRWRYININGFDVTCLGTFNRTIKGLEGIVPGIYIHTSEDGNMPIGMSTCIWRKICSNGMMVMDNDFLPLTMKRSENEDGGLKLRFKEGIKTINEEWLPAFKKVAIKLRRLNDFGVGTNRAAVISKIRKNHIFPPRYMEQISAAWLPEENTLFGAWNAITRIAVQTAHNGFTKDAHNLYKVAGKFVETYPYELTNLVGASNRKEKVA